MVKLPVRLTRVTAHPTDQPGVEVDDRRQVKTFPPSKVSSSGRVAHTSRWFRGRRFETRCLEQVVRDRLVVGRLIVVERYRPTKREPRAFRAPA